MKKTVATLVVIGASLHAQACGPYFDYTYIVATSPDRAFQLPELSMVHELREIPHESQPTDTRSVLPDGVALRDLCGIGPLTNRDGQWTDDLVDPSTAADLRDLFAALTDAGVDETTTTGICRDYFAVRAGFDKRLTTYALVPLRLSLLHSLETLAQLPREFFLYLDGARAFHQEKYGEAAVAFQAVLALPPEERRYKTTWSFYMLGRMAAMAQRAPELGAAHPEIAMDPLPYFELVRQCAAEGFVNSDDVAAGTYYQEAHLAAATCDWVKELHALARYDLTGDQYTHLLLKRASIKLADMDAIPLAVREDRLSRSVLVAFGATHVDARPKQAKRILIDLTADDQELTSYESGRLAWIAYAVGRIDQAKALVRLNPEDPYAIWTSSRLKLRSGDLEGALATLKKAVPLFDLAINWDRFDEPDFGEVYRPHDALHSEQAVLQLARDRYVDALDLFLMGGSWLDAAYVAEHVLTLDELLVYYQKCAAENRYAEPGPEYKYYSVYTRPPVWMRTSLSDREDVPRAALLDRLRALVARRMLREARYAGAIEFFPESWRHLAVAYVHHHNAGAGATDDQTRAYHHMQSAHLLRHWGMELIGYEADPDFTYVGGAYFYQETSAIRADTAVWRRFAASAMALHEDVLKRGNEWKELFNEDWMNTVPNYVAFVKPTAEERRRLAQNACEHYSRWHYRFVAAEQFNRAAKLLPDQTKELAEALFYRADVLRRVEGFRDAAKQRQHAYQGLVRRCGALDIGKAAEAKRWLPDEPETWKEAFGPNAINEAALAIASDASAKIG